MELSAKPPTAEIIKASKRFDTGVLALSEVSLSIGSGEFVTLLGPSGCGKSTILRLLAGLEIPSAGTVHAPADDGAQQYATAFVFQESTLMPWASVFNNVCCPYAYKDSVDPILALAWRPL
jgi:NitT/TauT family transport system ATP-binding protein